MKKADYIRYFLKSAPRIIWWEKFHHAKKLSSFAKHKNLSIERTGEDLAQTIVMGKSFAAIRFGAVEMGALNNAEKINLGMKKTYKDLVRASMKRNAGFYPCDDESLSEYARRFIAEAKETDYLGISGIHMEEYFYKKIMPNARVGIYEGFEPLHGMFTHALKGKKVLIVSPFKEEIENQYRQREKLFDDKDILPEFDLKVIKSPLTLAEEEPSDKSFFESLSKIEAEMGKIDFDVCLVGAGAYGSFIALYAKKMGKVGIQTGGATPTMFGIIGHRWEKREHVKKHVNEYWIKPYNKPKGFDKVENGAYW